MGWVLLVIVSVLIPLGISVLMEAFVCKTAKTTKTKVIFAAISSAAALCVIFMNTFFITIAGAAAYILGTWVALVYYLHKNRKGDEDDS